MHVSLVGCGRIAYLNRFLGSVQRTSSRLSYRHGRYEIYPSRLFLFLCLNLWRYVEQCATLWNPLSQHPNLLQYEQRQGFLLQFGYRARLPG